MKLRNIIIIVVVVGVLGLIAYRFATSGSQEKIPGIDEVRRNEGVPVDVYAVKTGLFEKWVEKTGNLEGFEQAPIYANMSGRVRSVSVKQGQKVGAGRTIIVLDPLSSTQTYSAQESTRLQYENLKREYERLLPLHKAGAISDSQLDQLKLGMDSARAALKDVSASLTLLAPISGVVTAVRVGPGDQVEPGETLAVVAKIDRARLKLEVSGRDVKMIRTGQPAVIVENGNGEKATGVVAAVSLSADPETRLFLVEIVLDAQGALAPGTLQRAKIRVENEESVLLVPTSSLLTAQGKTTVFVVKPDQTSEKREIEIGSQNGVFAVVRSGLNDGEQVVVWGANLLAGGEKVQIHKVVEQF